MKRVTGTIAASLALITLFAIFPGAAQAVTITWVGSVDNSWHTAGNWDLNRVPGAGDDVVLPNIAETPSVAFAGGTTVINSLVTSEVLSFNGGILSIAATSSSSNSLTLNGGTLTGAGTFLNEAGALVRQAGVSSTISCPFTNNGAVRVDPNCFLALNNLTNLNAGTLNGGTYELDGGLQVQEDVIQNGAFISLRGVAANLLTPTGDALRNLTQIGTGCTLAIRVGKVQTFESRLTNAQGLLFIDSSAVVNVNGGYLNYGETRIRGSLLSSPTGVFNDGILIGTGDIEGKVTNHASLLLGYYDFTGGLRIDGDYIQNEDGALYFDVAGTTALTQFDQIEITGTASLDGGIQVVMVDNFVPAVGSEFAILKAASVSGTFSYYRNPDVEPNCSDLYYQPDAVNFRVSRSVTIATQPQPQAVCGNAPVTLSVTATGDSLTYQWRRNSTSIPGATSSSYAIAGMTPADAASYDVIVTGVCNSITSAATVLSYLNCTEMEWTSVWNASTNEFPNQNCPWSLGDTATPEQPVLSGGVLTIATSDNAEQLYYEQTGFLDIPDTLKVLARLKVVSESHQAGNTRRGVTVAFTVAPDKANFLAFGRDEISLLSGFSLQGPTASVDTDDQFHDYLIEVQNETTVLVYQDDILVLTGAIISSPNFDNVPGFYWGDGTGNARGVSEWQTFRHNANTLRCGQDIEIVTQPESQEICGGQAASLTVTATGEGLFYQWRKDGAPVGGATSSILTIAALAPSDRGNYDVIVSSGFDSITSAVAVLSYMNCIAPIFNYTWDAGTLQFPDKECQFYLGDTATPENPVLSGGVLTLATSENAEDLFYEQVDSLAIPDTLRILARLKVVSESHTAGNSRHGVTVAFTVAPDKANYLAFGVDSLSLLSGFSVQGPTAYVDTDSQFHDYLIEVQHQSTVLVYQDNILVLVGSILQSPNFANVPEFYWGDGTGNAHGISQWMTYRHNANVTPCSIRTSAVEPGPAGLKPGIALLTSPNPSRGPLTLTVQSDRDLNETTSVAIYDVAGRIVTQIDTGSIPRGEFRIPWDGQDSQGLAVSNGVYFLRLQSEGKSIASGRVMILR
ncbi:MAG: FlgD immunoglobulin-like domain containing protein [Candidatus Eisenbacteria bacterium]|nr:FlgD immunoglobulin-like domain containing protein [Candidatus Eisenbacteria bacterium]